MQAVPKLMIQRTEITVVALGCCSDRDTDDMGSVQASTPMLPTKHSNPLLAHRSDTVAVTSMTLGFSMYKQSSRRPLQSIEHPVAALGRLSSEAMDNTRNLLPVDQQSIHSILLVFIDFFEAVSCPSSSEAIDNMGFLSLGILARFMR